jgi:hypothetical protein
MQCYEPGALLHRLSEFKEFLLQYLDGLSGTLNAKNYPWRVRRHA